MTLTPTNPITDEEYMILPLDASETNTLTCAYGEHLVPLDTDGAFDLPLLLAQTITTDELPKHWEKWGRVNRSEVAEAWHFYASDCKFATVLRDPFKLIDTKASVACEINVSTFEDDPLPPALSQLWRKRCVSRVWQDNGIKVFVDMHVSGYARGLLLDGVPKEHALYCTRYKRNDLSGDYLGIEAVEDDYDQVLDHISEDVNPTFLVYGLPSSLIPACEERGWICLPNAAVQARAKGA